MFYALLCPCNLMHHFLLPWNAPQLSVGALSLCNATTADRKHSFCFVKCKRICLFFSPLSPLLLCTFTFLTATGNKYTLTNSLWCIFQACYIEQDRDLEEEILRLQKYDINQNI